MNPYTRGFVAGLLDQRIGETIEEARERLRREWEAEDVKRESDSALTSPEGKDTAV